MLFTCVMTHLHRGAGWSCWMSGGIGSKQRRRETEGNCLFVLRLINKQSVVASSQSTRGSLLNITSIRKTLWIPAGETVWRYRRVFGVKHRIRHQIRSLSFWLTSVFYHSSPPSPPFFFCSEVFPQLFTLFQHFLFLFQLHNDRPHTYFVLEFLCNSSNPAWFQTEHWVKVRCSGSRSVISVQTLNWIYCNSTQLIFFLHIYNLSCL